MDVINVEFTFVVNQFFVFLAQRAISNQSAGHEDGDYEVITAYVMEDSNSVVQQQHELHSGPPSVRVSSNDVYVYFCI